MLDAASPLWQVGVTATLAWMAVQAHLSAVFVAAPLLAALASGRSTNVRPTFDERSSIDERRARDRRGHPGPADPFFDFWCSRNRMRRLGTRRAIAIFADPKPFRPWPRMTASAASPATCWCRRAMRRRSRSRCDRRERSSLSRIDATYACSPWSAPSVMATLLFATSTRSYDGYWFSP